MTIQQMDIEFQLKLHSIASNAKKGFQSEERIAFLNQAMVEYIGHIVNVNRDPLKEGYAGTRARLDELETITEVVKLPLYENDEESGYVPLPSNYFQGLDINAKTSCDTTKLTKVTKTYRYATVALPTAQITTGWRVSINTDAESEILFEYADHFTVGQDADLNYGIVPVLLRSVSYAGLTVYWERYGNLYKPGKFIFIFDSTDEILGSVSSALNDGLSVFNYATEVTRLEYTTTASTAWVPCRTVDASVRRKQAHAFTKSTYRSPLALLTKGNVLLYHFGNFTSTGIELVYIRKPLELSLELNQSCELGSTPGSKEIICRAIIDIAIRLVTASASNPAYPVATTETLIST